METRTKSFASIQSEVEHFTETLKAHIDVVDLQPLFFRLTLNTTMAVLFGKSMEDLEKQAAISEVEFARAFDHAQHRLAERGRLGDYYWLLGGKGFRRSCKMVHDFVDAIVVDALREADTHDNKESSSAPDRYIFIQALISQTKDRTILRDQVINILLAGRDTTACLLSWTL